MNPWHANQNCTFLKLDLINKTIDIYGHFLKGSILPSWRLCFSHLSIQNSVGSVTFEHHHFVCYSVSLTPLQCKVLLLPVFLTQIVVVHNVLQWTAIWNIYFGIGWNLWHNRLPAIHDHLQVMKKCEICWPLLGLCFLLVLLLG
jgi:hypothetical protein